LQLGWFQRLYDIIIGLRSRARVLVEPIMSRIREVFQSSGSNWSSRMLRLIQRFRKRVHEAR
jgi:hypothetical protein